MIIKNNSDYYFFYYNHVLGAVGDRKNGSAIRVDAFRGGEKRTPPNINVAGTNVHPDIQWMCYQYCYYCGS